MLEDINLEVADSHSGISLVPKMYKFTTHLANPNLILVRKQIGDASCTALVVMRAPRRTYAQFDKDACPPPPKAPPKSRKVLWTTVGATILTGAAVVYAKSSPDARNWLESNAPWANDFIALVYQENTTYWKATINQISRATTAIMPPPKFEPLYVQEKPPVKPELETKVTLIQTEECPPQQPPPIVITKDMVELEHEMHENTKLAIDNFKQAKKFCIDYNKALYAIVEAPIEDLDKKNFSSLRGAQNERDNLMKKAHESASKARCAIERAKAEEEARRSQSLWAAAEALLSATRRTGAEAKIDNEIKALEKAGKDDRLVQTVLNGIPQEARQKGIATEKCLLDKFEKLERTAMKVALIGREGASLPVYFLSWLQSKLLFQKFAEIPEDELNNKPTDFTKLDTFDIIQRASFLFAEIPEDELNNKPTDFTKLDTFDIIQRARYHMDHGDLQSALRYVNLLQGAPRAAAGDWADAARHHLEVRQAAQAVMAHASYPRQIDYRLVRITQSATNLKQFRKYPDRDPCPLPPPPPKPKEKDDRLIWGTVFLATLAGAFAYYAKQSPQTRDWLTIYAPWFDDMIAVIFQENMSYKEYMNECIESFKKYIHMDEKTDVCKIEEPPKAIPTVPEKPKEIMQPVKEVIEQPPCVRLPPPVLTKDICEVESCLKDLFETVINNYDTAKAACVYYCQAVDDTMNDFSMPKLKELRKAMEERMDLVRVSIQNALEAQEGMEELTRYLECGVQALPEAIEKTKEMMEQCQEKIKAMLIQYQWENDKALVRDRQWQMVETYIDKYTEENETLIPGLHYTHNKLRMDGDPDLLLYHTYRYKRDLEDELQEVVSGMKERADRAVDTIRSEDEKTERERKLVLENLTKLKRLELEKDFKTREENLKKKNEDMLKDALRKQLQRHEEMLEKKLKQREIEATAKLKQMVADKVAAEKRLFAKQRTEMAAKLKILEDKLAGLYENQYVGFFDNFKNGFRSGCFFLYTLGVTKIAPL
ncbi:Putative mitochondrial inner membrane protein [Papilio machaon]|uniref:MICOS complex subunit MIC60 n=1 Tax=Papilio machaon TaxID=76193 RepID=A0A0N1I590_PAPMA|nr:Putative mitochondrial inner membrane protein [Papilio machaon]